MSVSCSSVQDVIARRCREWQSKTASVERLLSVSSSSSTQSVRCASTAVASRNVVAEQSQMASCCVVTTLRQTRQVSHIDSRTLQRRGSFQLRRSLTSHQYKLADQRPTNPIRTARRRSAGDDRPTWIFIRASDAMTDGPLICLALSPRRRRQRRRQRRRHFSNTATASFMTS